MNHFYWISCIRIQPLSKLLKTDTVDPKWSDYFDAKHDLHIPTSEDGKDDVFVVYTAGDGVGPILVLLHGGGLVCAFPFLFPVMKWLVSFETPTDGFHQRTPTDPSVSLGRHCQPSATRGGWRSLGQNRHHAIKFCMFGSRCARDAIITFLDACHNSSHPNSSIRQQLTFFMGCYSTNDIYNVQTINQRQVACVSYY